MTKGVLTKVRWSLRFLGWLARKARGFPQGGRQSRSLRTRGALTAATPEAEPSYLKKQRGRLINTPGATPLLHVSLARDSPPRVCVRSEERRVGQECSYR